MRWRTILAGLVLVCVLSIPFSYVTYAKAGDVQDIQIQLLEERMLETRIKQCKAIVESNESAKQFYWEKLNELARKHFELTQVQYTFPACAEIL